MTREEAMEVLQQLKYTDMAIEALEKAPCEDCVSRQAVDELARAISNPTPNVSIQITEREKYGRFN